MNQLSIFTATNNHNAPAALTMTSREIAELTGKAHLHVLRDIRNMLEDLELTESSFGSSYKDSTGRTLPAFDLPKDLTLTLVAGYSVPLRHRIVTRWLELEAAQQPKAPAVPSSFREALLLAAQQQEVIEKQSAALALAAPKATAYDTVVADKMPTVNRYCRMFDGVNQNKVKDSLKARGYLYKCKKGYRVYAKFAEHFREKYDEAQGEATIFPTASGKVILAQLYHGGLLQMKKGHTPV
jgi:phage regulator Rha-like protein